MIFNCKKNHFIDLQVHVCCSVNESRLSYQLSVLYFAGYQLEYEKVIKNSKQIYSRKCTTRNVWHFTFNWYILFHDYLGPCQHAVLTTQWLCDVRSMYSHAAIGHRTNIKLTMFLIIYSPPFFYIARCTDCFFVNTIQIILSSFFNNKL